MDKRRIDRRGRVAAWVPAIVTAVTLGLTSGCTAESALAESPSPSAASVQAAPRSVDAETLGRLREHSREVEILDVAAQDPAISVQDAIARGAREFRSAKSPAQMSLVRFTNLSDGADVEEGSGATPGLTFENRPAWLLVFDKFQQPVTAPNGVHVPAYVVTRLAMFLDADTGAFLEAVTIGRVS